MPTAISVSYTHLDVYKRQAFKWFCVGKLIEEFLNYIYDLGAYTLLRLVG